MTAFSRISPTLQRSGAQASARFSRYFGQSPEELPAQRAPAIGVMMGKVLVSTELGGGGTARPDSIGLAKRGIRNFLVHAGVLHGRIEPKPSLQLDAPDDAWYVVSTTSGLIEFSVDLGQSVRAGILARRHFAGPVQTGHLIALDVQERSLTL